MPQLDLRDAPQAQTVIKRPIPIRVQFAETSGICNTLEGPVPFSAADAILTGNSGDTWPVERAIFESRYEPASNTAAGQNGFYIKRPLPVLAVQLEHPFDVATRSGGNLHGEVGDWLVQHAPGEFGIVRHDVFLATYEICVPQN